MTKIDINNNESPNNDDFKIKELEQEKILLEEDNTTLNKKTQELSSKNVDLEKKLSVEIKDTKELMQEKILLEEISNNDAVTVNKTRKKLYTLIVMIFVITSISFVLYAHYENQVLINTTSHLLANYNSNYVIQNLQGDIVNTWVAWNIQTGRILHINIVNTANLSQDKLDAIENAILSTKTVTLDDSLLGKGPKGTSSVYYTGWEGALTEAYSQPTTSYIPQKFDITGSSYGSPGDIVIILTNDENPDGLSGITKSIADGNEILKSKITIFRASELSAVQLEAITRHEFGHAMGLAHSTAPEDLMHATIQTGYPYISGCDIDAIKGLYDGKKKSEVVCQK